MRRSAIQCQVVGAVLVATLAAGGAVACSCGCSVAKTETADQGGKAKTAAVKGVWESDNVCVYKSGEWVLKVEYLLKGTRSEGQKGTLFKGGKEVKGKKKGNLQETTLGKLRHYGDERKVSWAVSGWNFAERSQVKPSSRISAK